MDRLEVTPLETEQQPITGPAPSIPAVTHRAGWPSSAYSITARAGGIDWHVQTMGSGPSCLLLHGTGASTHSWRDFAPALAKRFSVIAPDLPGHGFTQLPTADGMTLPGMSKLVAELLAAMKVNPTIAVGHSAGAAVLTRMAVDGRFVPPLIVSLNGALLPYPGIGRTLLPALARMLFLNPVVPSLFAWRAKDQSTVDAVIANTGSKIDSVGLGYYRQLFRDPDHVAATLRMMSNWDLAGLQHDLPKLRTALVLVATADDSAISPEAAFEVRDLVPGAEVLYLRKLGHLAHEECPQLIADIVIGQATAKSILAPMPV